MSRYVPNTYKNNRAARVIAKLLIGLVIVVVVFTIALFFGLRRYIVYTPEGLRLDVPWLEEPVATIEPEQASPIV